jgi:hypothetical protein
MRGDKSFAYDLIVRYGPVSSRVALLLRSAEGKPPSTRFVYHTLHGTPGNRAPGEKNEIPFLRRTTFACTGWGLCFKTTTTDDLSRRIAPPCLTLLRRCKWRIRVGKRTLDGGERNKLLFFGEPPLLALVGGFGLQNKNDADTAKFLRSTFVG